MNRRSLLLVLVLLVVAVAGASVLFGDGDARASQSPAERGRYLVSVLGCVDCHSPWKMGPQGPMPDPDRFLSGHPESLVITSPPPTPALPWTTTAAATNTAWAGPWGVSFTANLTPDPETGLGRWTAENFRAAIRTGRHLGKGRPVLPPMPIQVYRNLTDEDLGAVFSYLRTIPPIHNRVPEPLPPAPTGAEGR
jgi:mono/diheme cytochrome c family protein